MKSSKGNILILLILAMVVLAGCTQQTEQVTKPVQQRDPGLRDMVAAGKYYPADAATLSSVIDDYLQNAKTARESGNIRAIIVPHSSYPFSGEIAADAYNQIENDYDRVIIAAPIADLEGMAIPIHTTYETPLGNIDVDTEALNAIAEVTSAVRVEDGTHQIELQLPFLQQKLGDFKLVPFFIGKPTVTQLNALSQELAKLDGNNLIIITSEFSQGNNLAVAKKDTKCLSAINKLNINDFLNCQSSNYAGVLSVLQIAKKLNLTTDMITYKTSADTMGLKDEATGYAAIAFRKQQPEQVKD